MYKAIIKRSGKFLSNEKGATHEEVLKRDDIMSMIIAKDVDINVKRQFSNMYDAILELESSNKKYISELPIESDIEKELMDYIIQRNRKAFV